MEEMDIKRLFQARQDVLKGKLSLILNHPVTKGEHCESVWIDFLRSFLPARYAVDKGIVFDCKGKYSEQIDIIIYDTQYTPLIFRTDAGEKFVTVESVYAVFEVKQEINRNNMEYANQKIASVLSLEPTSRGIINAGRPVSGRPKTHIIGGILATEAITNDSIRDHLKELPHIDIGCAAKCTAFLTRRNRDNAFEDVVFSESEGETILTFFFMILDALYVLGTVAAIDIREYADKAITAKLNREVFHESVLEKTEESK
jgi:hypothetical protein